MRFSRSETQEEYRSIVSKFLAKKSAPKDVRALMETQAGYDPQVWEQLCSQIGVSCVHIPEELGGHGFGIEELGIVAEEMGRYLYCGPFFSSIVLGSLAVLSSARHDERSKYLCEIGEGAKLYSVALGGLDEVSDLGKTIQAECVDAEQFQLSGKAAHVFDAQIADCFLVFATEPGGISLFYVNPKDEGVTIEAMQSMDETRRVSKVTFNDTLAIRIGDPESVNLQLFWDQVCLILSCEMIGGAQTLLEATLEYMKTRYQFGRAIGSFQGLKHRCADLATNLELAKGATNCALRSFASQDRVASDVNMAKAMANEIYVETAIAAVQLHGGMGFTWENDTHLWFKRARSSQVMFGSTQWHRETMISRVLEETQ